MIEVNIRDVKEFEKDLKTYAKKAFPFATKGAVNTGAFETQKAGRRMLQNEFILRNRYSAQSVQVEQARTLVVDKQEAIVGSIVEYLATQEHGGTSRGTGAHKPIPTSYAAGQGVSRKPRTKLPRQANRMKNITLKDKTKGLGRKARNAAAIRTAAKSGNKYVHLDLGKKQGIFEVLAGRRAPRIKMLWDLTRTTVDVPRKPWLEPATDEVLARMPAIYADHMLRQLRRHKVFGY